MIGQKVINKLFVGVLWFIISTAQAGQPVWTFTPLTPTEITIAPQATANVSYQVMNQSKKLHRLVMQPIAGVTQITTGGNCPNPFNLAYHQSCILTLNINGSALNGDVNGGPVVCENGNILQCYQPSAANSLKITRTSSVYSTVGGAVSGLNTGASESVVLQNNGVDTMMINNNGSFVFPTPLPTGASYNVTVLTQPISQTCTVLQGSGTIATNDINNIQVNCADNNTTLSSSISNLALSITGLTEYGVVGTPSSGQTRVITITNTGNQVATNLSVNTPTWPAGTTNSTTCGSTLGIGSSCTISIIPGNTATSDGTNPCSTGVAPLPQAVQVTADNANPLSINVVVLGYGCIYQGGYVYAFDDTTSSGSSVGGKVVTTTDQADVIWSSDSNGNAVEDIIYGISETSTILSPDPSSGQVNGQIACDGATDGVCDTNNIDVFYENNVSPPINLSYYAAGVCKQTINSYSDWYLPAICEWGYDGFNSGSGCGTQGSPTLQNIFSNLSTLQSLSGDYWASTGSSSVPLQFAWNQFISVNTCAQFIKPKSDLYHVRCSRILT